MIKIIAKLVKALHSDTEPHQISLAICFAMIMGLTPLVSLHNILILFLVFLLRVNISAFILFSGIFHGCSYLLDPLFHSIGLRILTYEHLSGFWTELYNMVIFQLMHFNNTILMGSLVFSLIMSLPMFILSNFLIKKYREYLLAFVRKTKLAQWIFSSRIYLFYQKFAN